MMGPRRSARTVSVTGLASWAFPPGGVTNPVPEPRVRRDALICVPPIATHTPPLGFRHWRYNTGGNVVGKSEVCIGDDPPYLGYRPGQVGLVNHANSRHRSPPSFFTRESRCRMCLPPPRREALPGHPLRIHSSLKRSSSSAILPSVSAKARLSSVRLCRCACPNSEAIRPFSSARSGSWSARNRAA